MPSPTNYGKPTTVSTGYSTSVGGDEFYLLLEDGTSFLLLEDGVSKLILESSDRSLTNYGSPSAPNPTNYS